MPFWRREAPAPPPAPPPPVSNTELGFLLDPSVSQLILALYQQVTESGGHFFVEVRSRAFAQLVQLAGMLRRVGAVGAARGTD